MNSDISPEYYEYYDLIYNDRTEDLKMWQLFAQEAGGRILEIGCGTGRVLLALAEAGYPLAGIDISHEAIRQAQSKIQAPNVSILRADMRDFNLPSKDFALVLIPFNTFLHCLSLKDQLGCLQSIHKHMQDGGRLVIDVFFPRTTAGIAGSGGGLHFGHEFVDASGHLVQWYLSSAKNFVDQTADCMQILDRIDSEGIVHRTVIRFSFRFVYRREMELLLKVTGFEVESIYGDYGFSPLGEHSRKMILVARKCGPLEV